MVHTPEGEEQLQNWNETVHLSLLFLEAIAFEPVIFTTDFFPTQLFRYKACAFGLFAPFRKVTLTLYRLVSSTLNVIFTFVRMLGLSQR